MLTVGSTLGRYRIVRHLGSGGMGEVYAAEDLKLRREVAIKVLPAKLGRHDDQRRLLEREARAAAALNHPNIVTLHSVEHDGDVVFITMELVEGRSLSDEMPKGGMPFPRLVKLAIQLADALALAHERGITHRDLKPANVMVTADTRLKVLDFGLAKAKDDAQALSGSLSTLENTVAGQIKGTVAYMSPEQAEGRPVDPRSDIFSFGVVLYEMATGERPFGGDSMAAIISAILRDAPPLVTQRRSELPSGLNKIIGRCLEKHQSARYQSALDLRLDLQELVSTTDVPGGSSPVRKGNPKRRMAVALGAAVALIIAGAEWIDFQDRLAPATFETERVARLTSDGDVQLAAISPDGRYVVHVKHVNNRSSLWVRQVGTTNDIQILEPGDMGFGAISYGVDGTQV